MFSSTISKNIVFAPLCVGNKTHELIMSPCYLHKKATPICIALDKPLFWYTPDMYWT